MEKKSENQVKENFENNNASVEKIQDRTCDQAEDIQKSADKEEKRLMNSESADENLKLLQTLDIGHYFLFMLIFTAFFLCYKMLGPYLDPIIIGIILSVLTNPVYQWLKQECRNKKSIAAFISCILLILIIIIPLTLIFLAIIKQGVLSFNAINKWIAAGNIEKLAGTPFVSQVIEFTQKHIKASLIKDMDINSIMITISSHAGEIMVNQGKYIISNITSVIGKFFLMTFVFFFAVQDQEKNFRYIFHLVPLSSSHERILVDKIKAVAKSAILGTIITGASQGIAGGIAFYICGLPGFFWGAVMAFASLIPMVGTSLVWLPASIWLFISGAWKSGVFLIIWSVVVVGMMDNIVRPLFMKGAAGMSSLLIFFSILGGLSYFGLTGLLYGPMIFGMTMVLLYIYDLEFRFFLDHQDEN